MPGRIDSRLAKLEAATERRSWRAYWSLDGDQWPDHALVDRIGDACKWPPGYAPALDELEAVRRGERPRAGNGRGPRWDSPSPTYTHARKRR